MMLLSTPGRKRRNTFNIISFDGGGLRGEESSGCGTSVIFLLMFSCFFMILRSDVLDNHGKTGYGISRFD